jgi:hypothetical protein
VSEGGSGVDAMAFARGGGAGAALLRRNPSPDFDCCQTTGADAGARTSGPFGATGAGF